MTDQSLLETRTNSDYSADMFDAWARKRLGKPVDALTVTDIQTGLAVLGGLSYRERSSGKPLGGRIAPHLRHVEEAEAMRLLRRADDFLSARPSPPRPRRSRWLRHRRGPNARTLRMARAR
jgi:hypothetical protein